MSILATTVLLGQLVLSEHNSLHKAIERGIYEKCGIELSIVQSPRYTVLEGGQVKGMGMDFACPETSPKPSSDVTVSFDYPTTRTNGEPLQKSEIEKIVLEVYPDKEVKAYTVDTDGLTSSIETVEFGERSQ